MCSAPENETQIDAEKFSQVRSQSQAMLHLSVLSSARLNKPNRKGCRMISALRSVSAIFMGFITGFVLIVALEYLGLKMYPLPSGTDPTDPVAMNAAMAAMPIGAMVMVLFGWAVGVIGASFVAAWFAQQLKGLHGMLIGLIFMGGAIMNMRQFHHPLWFWIVGVLLFLPAAYLGSSVAAGLPSATASK
jgi:hypothetical protein